MARLVVRGRGSYKVLKPECVNIILYFMKYPLYVFKLIKRFYRWRIAFWKNFSKNLSLGFYLAHRQLKRSNIWTTGLIIFVMTLTFLNLVVISGILVGIVEG